MPRKLLLSMTIALVLLAGCGKGDAKVNATSIGKAADTTAAARTATFEATFSIKDLKAAGLTAGAGPIKLVSTGSYDLDQKALDLSLDIGPLLSALADQLPATFKVGGPIEMRSIGDTTYAKLGPIGLLFGAADGWVQLGSGQGIGDLLGGKSVGGFGSDPSKLLQQLKGASGDITTVGTEDVRGVATTHYKGTIDVDKARKSLAADQKDLATQMQALADAGVKTAPFEVWLDNGALVRRYVSSLSMAQGTTAGNVEVTVELFDFGKAVTVAAPPADQVTKLNPSAN